MNPVLEAVVQQEAVHCRAIHNADVDLQAAGLGYEGWGQRYDQLSAGAFRGSIHEIKLPAFTLMRETSNRVLLQKGCTPHGIFAIGTVMGLAEHGFHCGEIMRPRSAALLDPLTEFEIRTPERFDLIAAVFSPEDLCDNLGDPAVDYRELETELMHSAKTIESRHSVALADFLLRAFETSQESPQRLLIPSNQKQLAEEFYALLTETVSAAGQGNAARGVCPNRERIVRRVRSYLDANPESALSISEICEEVGVSRRTLQNAMQEVFGISPQHYLKAIRLNGFRRALKACDPGRESIGDVAARWGFWHLSQLAQDYRRLFGELPSQTRERCLNA
jgi:AraC family ethanolamine operon transcriptional activator